MECCNTPDMTFPICTPTLAVSGVKLFYFLGFLSPCVVIVVMHLISWHHVHCICIRVHLMHSSIFPVVCFAFCSCHAYHIMSSCALHLHTCSSHASEHFPRCPFCNPALLSPPVHPSCFLSRAGVKDSRNGPRLVKWPQYTTRRPPVKFCSIWRSFGTPTVNRASAKSI